MRVKLLTRDGGFVAEKDIPNYVTGQPDVIVWGNRTFKPVRNDVPVDAEKADFEECFTHVIVD